MSDQPTTTIPYLESVIGAALEMRLFGGRELNLRQRLEIAKHLNATIITAAGYDSQHKAYEKGFAAGFDRASDDIGAWENIVDYGEDTSANPYPTTDQNEAES